MRESMVGLSGPFSIAEGATTPETLRPQGPHHGQALWKADD